MKVTVVAYPPADRLEYDVVLDVTVTRRRVGRAPASTKTVSVAVWQGAGFVGGCVICPGAEVTVEDTRLRAVVTRLVCGQLYLRGDLADALVAEIPAFSAAQMRRFQAALENTQAFKRAFAGVPLPQLPQGR